MSKTKLTEILTRRLRLKRPRFVLRTDGRWYYGNVISDTFKGKTNFQRQRMIHDALEAEVGPRSLHRVAGVLAYTDDEWDKPLERLASLRNGRPRPRKKAG